MKTCSLFLQKGSQMRPVTRSCTGAALPTTLASASLELLKSKVRAPQDLPPSRLRLKIRSVPYNREELRGSIVSAAHPWVPHTAKSSQALLPLLPRPSAKAIKAPLLVSSR